ncbi:diaminopimelate epimerase [Virgibacillus salexigens]|uniref:Diaminopimelate epimerase n=1 Tax=Virgibacillus kapii TaxID=1638645 RepID=A0ABQ2DLA6_9BACI|nr:diaminopimelate epimerase [Virgibacillus kapii]GGJ62588.1 diaminopimelate epimerase [Virgibacillus kapii]
MKFSFTKMHGLGNSYVYVDLFQEIMDESKLSAIARQVSSINTGIGSDGLILIQPSEQADLGMRIFNKDGSEGQSCGNGLRCVAKYAYEQGIVQSKQFTIETKANIVDAEVAVENSCVELVTINMGKPILQRNLIPMVGALTEQVIAEAFTVNGIQLNVTAVSMGNPHAIFFVDKLKETDVLEIGPLIEKDDRFPDGVNVEFIEVVSPTEINFSVWERGSGVTQACGTGACASVVAAILTNQVSKNEEITVHLPGGDLYIKWDNHDYVWMTGDAETIATGVYYASI